MEFLKLLLKPELRTPLLIAWGIAVVVTALVVFTTGQIYGVQEAKNLLISVQKTSLYYGSTIAGASATVLALMLTMLNLTSNRDDPDKESYTRLHAISTFCVLSFIGAVLLLLAISFPVVDFEKVPRDWYAFIYYVLCVWNGVLSALMISTILILRDLAVQLIGKLSPDFDEDGEEK